MNLCRDCGDPVGEMAPLAWRCFACAEAKRQAAQKAQKSAARNSARARIICWDAHHWLAPITGRKMLTCHECKSDIDPGHKKWEADHIRRHSEGGKDTAKNVLPICIPCHRRKSAADTTAVAKGKRFARKHYGVKKAKRPMDGSRDSGWRKRMDGTVERRG